MEMAKKTVRLLIIFSLVFAFVFIAQNYVAMAQEVTSFPWWSPLVFVLLYFGPILLVECVLYGILVLIEKRKK